MMDGARGSSEEQKPWGSEHIPPHPVNQETLLASVLAAAGGHKEPD